MAAIAIVVTAVLISMNIFFGPKAALKKTLDAFCSGKVSNMSDMAPKEYWEYLADKKDKSRSDVIDDAKDNFSKFYDKYVEDHDYSYKILSDSKEKISSDKLDDIKDDLHKHYDITKSHVTEAYMFSVRLMGKEDTTDSQKTQSVEDLITVKISRHWYIVDKSGSSYSLMVAYYTDDRYSSDSDDDDDDDEYSSYNSGSSYDDDDDDYSSYNSGSSYDDDDDYSSYNSGSSSSYDDDNDYGSYGDDYSSFDSDSSSSYDDYSSYSY